jgi:protein-disulfide isomerase
MLARRLGIDGTPAFLVGDQLVSGANRAAVTQMLDAAVEQAS